MTTEEEEEIMIIKCPHCDQLCEIIKLNCCIFRCGIYKSNYKQIPPHLSKIKCDFLVEQNLIYGCGKPFQIMKNSDNLYTIVICDYI